MRITSRTASLIYKFALALIGTVGLLSQAGVFRGELDSHFFFMFTHISNIAVVVYVWATIAYALLKPATDPGDKPLLPKVKHALMLAIMVTCLIAATLLPDFGMVFTGGGFHWTMLVLHFIVPLGFVADWALFDKKGIMQKHEPPTWVIFPLVYLVYIVICVEGFGVWARDDSRWPYPFINFDANGVPLTLLICLGLIVFFVAFGYGLYAIDHKLAKETK